MDVNEVSNYIKEEKMAKSIFDERNVNEAITTSKKETKVAEIIFFRVPIEKSIFENILKIFCKLEATES